MKIAVFKTSEQYVDGDIKIYETWTTPNMLSLEQLLTDLYKEHHRPLILNLGRYVNDTILNDSDDYIFMPTVTADASIEIYDTYRE